MGGLLLKLQNFKKVKLIFGHPVVTHIELRHFETDLAGLLITYGDWYPDEVFLEFWMICLYM